MNFGYLSQYFAKFAWKRVTSVEVDPSASNGHEFNSSSGLREILGTTTRKCKEGTGIETRFVYLTDREDSGAEAAACLSWYDSRARHKSRTEWRLYYTDNAVIGREGLARAGDFLIIAFTGENEAATVLVAEAGSTYESQLQWLFGISNESLDKFEVATIPESQFVDSYRARILEAVGVAIPATDDSLLERMIRKFGNDFPTTAAFGKFIRDEITDIRAEDDADAAIIAWMEDEEFAFRVFEKFIVGARLSEGFKDVDEFVRCSLSVQNRRKSRAGHAFENHLSAVFRAHGVAHQRSAILEDKGKPDFLFPGIAQYFDSSFPDEQLTLLGAKTSCKDRWRQVLAEGARIKRKHLVTLEPAISATQLAQMRNHDLQLVVPAALHVTYPKCESEKLWDLATFIDAVLKKQKLSGVSAVESIDRKPSVRPRRKKKS